MFMKKLVTLSLDEKTIELLNKQAKRYGLNASKYIRELLYAVEENPDSVQADLRGSLSLR